MKQNWKTLTVVFFLGLLLPALCVRLPGWFKKPTDPKETVSQTQPAQNTAREHRVPILLPSGSITVIPLEDYIVAVVQAEMPAYFEFEALRAQAVAARTFALRCHLSLGKHPGGAVCTDPACCQAYLSREDYLAQGGSADDADKIRRAVASTTGQVVTYEGELIEAPYFSCSGGRTEDAAAVWGNQVPYLLSLVSPGEEEAAVYQNTVTFTPEEFCDLLGRSLPGSPHGWFGYPTYTAGGGVATVTVGGQSYTGTQLRKLLGLNSTAFSFWVENGMITVTTRGKGHRVGMSQYGADAMALKGHTYDAILRYYYPGTRIDKIDTLG